MDGAVRRTHRAGREGASACDAPASDDRGAARKRGGEGIIACQWRSRAARPLEEEEEDERAGDAERDVGSTDDSAFCHPVDISKPWRT